MVADGSNNQELEEASYMYVENTREDCSTSPPTLCSGHTSYQASTFVIKICCQIDNKISVCQTVIGGLQLVATMQLYKQTCFDMYRKPNTLL